VGVRRFFGTAAAAGFCFWGWPAKAWNLTPRLGMLGGGGADDSVGDHVVLQYKLSFLDDIIVMKYFTF